MSQRTERIDELLRQEIGTILSREAKDPRIGFVTITEVETTPDLRHARVWVSVIGTPAEREATMTALAHTMHFVRRELGPRLRLKHIPELHVKLDDSIERGTRVLRLLQDLEAGVVPDEASETDTLPTPVRRLGRPGDAEDVPPDDAPPAAAMVDRRPRRRGSARAPGAKEAGRAGRPRRGGSRP